MRASIAAAASLFALASIAEAQTYAYAFASASAAGINGTIVVKYADAQETTKNATITADLDFSGVNLTALTAAQASCTTLPTAYAWHIHVSWPTADGTPASASYAQCAKAITGNHYDPLLACGPNSQWAGQANCTSKTTTYACNPDAYKADSSVCEKGDFSGKFGKFAVDQATKKSTGKWTDTNYPLLSENTAQWNIVLHAVCGSDTPRVACAVGKYEASVSSTATTKPTSGAWRLSVGSIRAVVAMTSLVAVVSFL